MSANTSPQVPQNSNLIFSILKGQGRLVFPTLMLQALERSFLVDPAPHVQACAKRNEGAAAASPNAKSEASCSSHCSHVTSMICKAWCFDDFGSLVGHHVRSFLFISSMGPTSYGGSRRGIRVAEHAKHCAVLKVSGPARYAESARHRLPELPLASDQLLPTKAREARTTPEAQA